MSTRPNFFLKPKHRKKWWRGRQHLYFILSLLEEISKFMNGWKLYGKKWYKKSTIALRVK